MEKHINNIIEKYCGGDRYNRHLATQEIYNLFKQSVNDGKICDHKDTSRMSDTQIYCHTCDKYLTVSKK